MKKIISLVLVLVLALTAIGGTLAYFTDTDTETNTFTAGGVEIEIIEEQRNEDGTEIEAYEDGKELMPINGSAQGPKDKWGLVTAENYVDKIITVKNLKSDAYVRLYIGIPAELDNVKDAGKNVLHVNVGNKYDPEGKAEGQENVAIADYNTKYWTAEKLVATNVEIEGTVYNVYCYTYLQPLTKDEITDYAAIVGVYLDENVDYDNEKQCYVIGDKEIEMDLSKDVKIPVFAIGAQAAGFETTGADAALEAAFGANYNPWAK